MTPHLRAGIFEPARTRLQQRRAMRDLLPGGYVFTHLIFWTVVGLVAVGTNAVAIMLLVGLGVLVLETATKQK